MIRESYYLGFILGPLIFVNSHMVRLQFEAQKLSTSQGRWKGKIFGEGTPRVDPHFWVPLE